MDDPVISNVTLQITGIAKKVSVSNIKGKIIWQSNGIRTNFIKLPIEKYVAGTYFLTITNGKESKTVKVIN